MKILVITLSLIGVVCGQQCSLSNAYSCGTMLTNAGLSLNASNILAFCGGTCPDTIRDCAQFDFTGTVDDAVEKLTEYCQLDGCFIRFLQCYNEIEILDFTDLSAVSHFCGSDCITTTLPECSAHLPSVTGLDTAVNLIGQACESDGCFRQTIECLDQFSSFDFSQLSTDDFSNFCNSTCVTTTLPGCISELPTELGLEVIINEIENQACDPDTCFRQTVECFNQFSSLNISQLSFEDVSKFCNSPCVTTTLPECTSHLLAELGLDRIVDEIENKVCTAPDGSCFYRVLDCINRFDGYDFEGGLTQIDTNNFCKSDCITTTLHECTPNFPEELISLDEVKTLVQTTCGVTIGGTSATGGATKPYTLSTLISAIVVAGMAATLSFQK